MSGLGQVPQGTLLRQDILVIQRRTAVKSFLICLKLKNKPLSRKCLLWPQLILGDSFRGQHPNAWKRF